MKYRQFANKGIAIIAVLLIIMTLTVVALVSLRGAQGEASAISGYKYNRQATYAAHSVGNFVYNSFEQSNAEMYFAEITRNGAWLYSTQNIVDSTGLASGNTKPTQNAITGDLKRSFQQFGSVEDLAMVVGDTVGMSDATMFCRYNMTMVGIAVAGRSPKIKNGSFTMHALDTRASARKYELGYVLLQPAPCQ